MTSAIEHAAMPATPPPAEPGPSGLRQARRHTRGRSSAIAGSALVLAILAACIIVPMFSPYSTSDFVGTPLEHPSGAHLFGTDDLGRDVFVRAFVAGRVDILLAITGAAIALAIGTGLGVSAAMARRSFWDSLLMRIVDAVIAFPGVVLILALVLVIGAATSYGPIPAGVPSILIAVFVTHWAVFARIARAQTLAIRDGDYIQVTRVLGYSRLRVVFRHVLPNVIGPSVAYAITDAIRIIVVISSLPFLGAGVEPPAPEWGNMMYEGRVYLADAWWVALAPGLLLAMTGIGLAVAAEGFTTWASGTRKAR